MSLLPSEKLLAFKSPPNLWEWAAIFSASERLRVVRYFIAGVGVSLGYTITFIILMELLHWRSPMMGGFNSELRSYLRLGNKSGDFDDNLLTTWDRKQALHDFLNGHEIRVFFVQPHLFNQLKSLPAASPLLEDPESLGLELRRRK
jgi:hypothetical protein